MGGVHVEPWAPEYGSPVEIDPDNEIDPGEIDDTVEVAGDWHPIREPGDGVSVLAFVDGVRRPEARITVDDDEGLRESLQLVLASEGYEVAVAADADGALARLELAPPDVVLCDLRMPGVDGMELLPQLARRLPTATIVMRIPGCSRRS